MDQPTILAALQLMVQQSRANEREHTIPDGIPAPRFALGDSVRLTSYQGNTPPTGAIITGREYNVDTWSYLIHRLPPDTDWHHSIWVVDKLLTPYTASYSEVPV